MLADFGLTHFTEALVVDTQTPFVIVARVGTHGERCGGQWQLLSGGIDRGVLVVGRLAEATSTITTVEPSQW